ncbi:MAG: DUF389 domain-containing protein [Acidimicrobiales bacterium]
MSQSATDAVTGWLARSQQISDEHRLDIFREVYLDGRNARQRVFRFALLMIFASVLATAGVLADSTAVVIGAMLIAPLITPMMGMALGLALGWPSRLRRATALVAGGIAIAISTGWLIPAVLPVAVATQTNSEILSRTSPNLLDLLVAVAAGAAGAYALARPDVASSLPGVAVAIALVPPLAVVGITLGQHEWRQATGAGLLFSTNLVAILVTGGLVFVLTGVARWPRSTFATPGHCRPRHRRHSGRRGSRCAGGERCRDPAGRLSGRPGTTNNVRMVGRRHRVQHRELEGVGRHDRHRSGRTWRTAFARNAPKRAHQGFRRPNDVGLAVGPTPTRHHRRKLASAMTDPRLEWSRSIPSS